jgi:hypothetical protein
MNTRALARSLFPSWPRRRLARWVLARLRVAQHARPAFAALMPKTDAEYRARQPIHVFAPRSIRESLQ